MTEESGNDQDAINQAEWDNPDNWTMPICYFSKKDTRWLVPKKNPIMGWTFNLGRTEGAWAFLLLLLLPSFLLAFVVILLSAAVTCL